METTKELLTTENLKRIHKAIHGKNIVAVMINGRRYEVKIARNRCRYIDFNGIRFMEQNKYKNSEYARRARNGERITWGIRPGRWIYIDDNEIKV